MNKVNANLYFITDSSLYGEEEFINRVEAAIKGGAGLVQLREKDKTTSEYLYIANKVHEVTKKYKVPLIINDRLDIAMAIDAEGVHLGQSDMPVKTARAIWGKDKIIGSTAKTVEQACSAYNDGADYLGVGAIYPTTTKVKTVLTSTDTLSRICTTVPIPVYAIGGLNKENIDVLKDINISGICVVSAVMNADSPEKAAHELVNRYKEIMGL